MRRCTTSRSTPPGAWAGRRTTSITAVLRSHVVSVLTERASNAYKALLRRLGISYVIAGKDEPDGAVLHQSTRSALRLRPRRDSMHQCISGS